MTAPPDSKHLQLSVTNLGPIARADIDLRPMTVFVGPSNTGKSYLAILIYALHGFFSGKPLHPAFYLTLADRTIFGFDHGPADDQAVSHKDVDAVIDWFASSMPETRTEHSSRAIPIALTDSVAKLVRRWLEGICDYDRVLDTEIARCFGIEDSSSLVRNRVASGTQITVNRPVLDTDEAPTSLGYGFSIKGKNRHLTSHIPSKVPLRFLVNQRSYEQITEMVSFLRSTRRNDDDRRYVVRDIMHEIVRLIGPDIVRPLSHPAYYLPADRTGVMHAHRVVVGSIIGQASRAGFQRDVPLPQLSGVLADFLEQLIGLGDRREITSRTVRGHLAQRIEEDILQGEISMEQSPVGYPEFFYRPKGWKENIGLMNTSSMVSELVPIVLYLRHVVRPGELLIIEEPESSLHPAMQVEFVRHLAAAVNSGVRIMITTHSEWVLDELANLMHLSGLPEDRRDGIGGAGFALDPSDVGIWLFEPKQRPKGSVVREIPFDVEFGGIDSGFDDVAIHTHNDYAAISNRISEDKAEYRPD